MMTHFFRKKCTLRLVRPQGLGKLLGAIAAVGFGAGVLDLGTVILSILMNNQILRYGDTVALAVYGVVTTISSLLQALFGGVGQAIQPIVSANFGAGNGDRVRAVWRLSLGTVLAMGLVFTAACELFPGPITRVFMAATPEALDAAPGIFRRYFLLLPFLGVTVLSTYYLQSVRRESMAIAVSLLRSAVVSGALLYLLPPLLGLNGLWLALPLSEAAVAVLALLYIRGRNRDGLAPAA